MFPMGGQGNLMWWAFDASYKEAEDLTIWVIAI
jgi:hypothetical protein